MPSFLQMSSTFMPASACLSALTICSSVYLLFLVSPILHGWAHVSPGPLSGGKVSKLSSYSRVPGVLSVSERFGPQGRPPYFCGLEVTAHLSASKTEPDVALASRGRAAIFGSSSKRLFALWGICRVPMVIVREAVMLGRPLQQ